MRLDGDFGTHKIESSKSLRGVPSKSRFEGRIDHPHCKTRRAPNIGSVVSENVIVSATRDSSELRPSRLPSSKDRDGIPLARLRLDGPEEATTPRGHIST